MPKNLQECIDQLIIGLNELKSVINEAEKDPSVASFVEKKKVTFDPTSMPEPPEPSLADLLASDKWPEAVNMSYVCDVTNPEELAARGCGIVDLQITSELEGKKFLDFGCGLGYSTKHVASDRKAAKSVGYDLHSCDEWNDSKGAIFTTDWNQVVAEGPYDVIQCFDVIDHLENELPEMVIGKLKSVLDPNGKIFLRAHPFTSRHANHFYNKKNKAYIHLIFSEEELKSMFPEWGDKNSGYEYNAGVVRPIVTYKKYFEENGLQIELHTITSEDVESFFKTPRMMKIIKQRTKMNDFFPEPQMKMQFIDYVLSHKRD